MQSSVFFKSEISLNEAISDGHAIAGSRNGIRLKWQSDMIPATECMSIAAVFAQREALGPFKRDGVAPTNMDDLVNVSQ